MQVTSSCGINAAQQEQGWQDPSPEKKPPLLVTNSVLTKTGPCGWQHREPCALNGAAGFAVQMVLQSACSDLTAHALRFPARREHGGMSETQLCQIAVVQGIAKFHTFPLGSSFSSTFVFPPTSLRLRKVRWEPQDQAGQDNVLYHRFPVRSCIMRLDVSFLLHGEAERK